MLLIFMQKKNTSKNNWRILEQYKAAYLIYRAKNVMLIVGS